MNKQTDGKFPAGRGPGRPKGSKNKTTRTLKEAILLAAAEVGEDGSGEGELVGYLRRVAREDVKAMSALLGRVLPIQGAGDDGEHLLVHKVVFEVVKP